MSENKIFDITLYNDDFFAWHKKYAHEYSMTNMKWLLESHYRDKISSVIDFGCGIGSYLVAAHQCGIKQIRGYEIALQQALPYIDGRVLNRIVQHDCTLPIPKNKRHPYHRVINQSKVDNNYPLLPENRKYDLVLSFETIEHVEPSGTEQFIINMIDSLLYEGMILFTGAPPGQEGCGHINCRDKSEWILLFEKHGVINMPHIATEISKQWLIQGCPTYISENLLCFKFK